MTHDLFVECFAGEFVPANATARAPTVASPMAGLTTTRHDDGTRTLTHGATVMGHYERVRARWGAPPHWRGVTAGGRLVSAVTEPGVRRALLEAAI